MTKRAPVDLAKSVSARLVRIAHDRDDQAQDILIAYCFERLLYRVSLSAHADRFILKGARLFSVWLDAPYRATHDLDLLGSGDGSIEEMARVFRDICTVSAADDAVRFDPDSVAAVPIREEDIYGGVRVKLMARIGSSRATLQIDIGLGDAVVPPPERAAYPVLLPFPAPMVRMYPAEAMIAEKLQAMVVLDMANSRMKDFFDIWALATNRDFEGARLYAAIKATFERRGIALPDDPPVGLTSVFVDDAQKKTQWNAFLRKTRPRLQPPDLAQVVDILREFLMPPIHAARLDTSFENQWPAGGPWG